MRADLALSEAQKPALPDLGFIGNRDAKPN